MKNPLSGPHGEWGGKKIEGKKQNRNWASHLKGLLAFYRSSYEIFIIQTRLSPDLYANIAICRSFFSSFNVYQFEYVWKRNLCGKILVAATAAAAVIVVWRCIFVEHVYLVPKWKINWDAVQHIVLCESMQKMEIEEKK